MKTRSKLFHSILDLPKPTKMAFVSVCFTFVFSMFFLMPLDLYLNNYIEFNIDFMNVALPLLAISVGLFFVFILILPFIFRGAALDTITLLLLGLSLFFYVQVLFLNGEVVELFGGGTKYSERSPTRTINLLIFIIVIFIPLIIQKWFLNRKIHKIVKWENGLLCATIIILGMQTTGVVAAISNYDSKSVKKSHYFSYNKTLELSSEENICVFVMDYLDVKYMNDALLEYPELYDQLDGFTFFENNVSVYMYTFPTITYMLTGEILNSDDSRPAYWDRAWAKRNIIDVLRENGYRSTLLISKPSTYNSLENIKNRADNFMEYYESDVKINHYEIAKITLAISFGRAVPYYYKDIFFMNLYSDFSNDFFTLADYESPSTIGVKTDLAFYNKLKTIGLYTQNNHKVFTFIHLNSAHDGGYHYNSDADTVEPYAGDYRYAVRGSFAIINNYFTQMKELGIYDSSTIVILADHGRNPIGGLWHKDNYPWDGVTTPALLIKPKNERGSLERNQTAELSHTNFRASILQFAGLPHEDFGLSYSDIINGSLRQTRTHYWLEWENANNYTLGDKFEIRGDANDLSNWKYVQPEKR